MPRRATFRPHGRPHGRADGRGRRVPAAPPAPRRGLTALDAVTLVAVVTVLVLVSLPRLAAFARAENRDDAAWLVRHVASEAATAPHRELRALVDAALLPDEDTAWLRGGTLLRRHGYLVDLTRHRGGLVVRAWPWAAGRTGRGAFVHAEGRLLEHPDPAGRWSGPDRPPGPPFDAAAGWRPLP